MKNSRMPLVAFFGVLLFSLSLSGIRVLGLQVTANSASKGTTGGLPTRARPTVNVLFNGPFAFVQQGDGSILVLLPDVKDHNRPVAVASGDFSHIKTLQRGDYDFTKGILSANNTIPLIPVPNTSVLSVSTAAEHLPTVPQETPYLSLKLPKPREIAPWNADDLQISSQLPVNTPSIRLATSTVLRYDPAAQPLEIDGPDFTWRPTAAPVAISEQIIAISVEPVKDDDWHTHARDAFRHLTYMLGLNRYIEFPVQTNKRNEPLNPNVLPQELTGVLPGVMADGRGTHNDCKAPAIIVVP